MFNNKNIVRPLTLTCSSRDLFASQVWSQHTPSFRRAEFSLRDSVTAVEGHTEPEFKAEGFLPIVTEARGGGSKAVSGDGEVGRREENIQHRLVSSVHRAHTAPAAPAPSRPFRFAFDFQSQRLVKCKRRSAVDGGRIAQARMHTPHPTFSDSLVCASDHRPISFLARSLFPLTRVCCVSEDASVTSRRDDCARSSAFIVCACACRPATRSESALIAGSASRAAAASAGAPQEIAGRAPGSQPRPQT